MKLPKLRITVLVDDFISERGVKRGALPVHGLGLYVEGKSEDGKRFSLVIDGGPLWEVMVHNVDALGVNLERLNVAVGTVWSAHHIAALLDLAREGRVHRLLLPPLPKLRAGGREELAEIGIILLPLESPLYNERVVMLKLDRGYAAVVSCSIYGLDSVIRSLKEFEEATNSVVNALLGGFNLSTFNNHDVRLLLKFARARNAVLVPLHSTSIEAREKLCKITGLDEVPGVGSRYTLE